MGKLQGLAPFVLVHAEETAALVEHHLGGPKRLRKNAVYAILGVSLVHLICVPDSSQPPVQ